MKIQFNRVRYAELKARQKENFNFQKVSGILADYGFSTVRLTDDWEGADFVAQHADGLTMLRVQLKPRLYFSKKYLGKQLWICFRDGDGAYLFPHDVVLELILKTSRAMTGTKSWKDKGAYSFKTLSKATQAMLAAYRLPIASPTPKQNV